MVTSATEGKSAGLAALLSFLIPGLGQFYVGQIGKGIMFVILGFVGWGLISSVIGIVLGVPLLIIIWIWSMVDAYKACQ